MAPSRRAVVINQFAMPRTEWGLTRNAELFSRVDDWDVVIFSASRDHYGQREFTTTDPLFKLASVPAYRGSAVRRAGGWLLFSLKAFFFTVTRRRLDLVFASSPHLFGACAGLLAARIRRVPFVLEVRDLWPESIVAAGMLRRDSRVHRILVRVERVLYSAAARIVVVTNGWEDHLAEFGVPVEKILTIPNGVEVAELPDAGEKARLRAELGLPTDRLVAVYTGAHGKANGLDQVIDAAAALPDVEFLLVGAGQEKAGLQADVARRDLGNVTFRDPVPKTELISILNACDLGIHVLAPWDLLTKGLSPNKVFDYLGCGLPMASNCREGLADALDGVECGHLTGFDGLTEAIRTVAEASESQRRAWGEAGRALVARRYSRAANGAILGRALDEVAAG
ncbi:glycosyltransferase family 4 protein [Marmoricola sp. RAF53]|uniref:glycosyltransferase family 4 protein n=1 Tax=Marmoricola sp. RAF53 TaxID=3233059 RepID=UPI003F948E37